MRQRLKLHPDSRCAAVTRIDVDVTRPRPGALALRFILTGRMSALRMPPVTPPSRADELWRHTCFEAFIRPAPGGPYYEFNFAPSTQWAVYRFDGYRSGMSAASEAGAPHIETHSHAEGYHLQATLELDRLPGFRGEAPWRLGLAAVIEETRGQLSYWALTHPPGKADFHHSDCFAAELPGS